jgi:hypothetical protein
MAWRNLPLGAVGRHVLKALESAPGLSPGYSYSQRLGLRRQIGDNNDGDLTSDSVTKCCSCRSFWLPCLSDVS